MGRKKQRVSEFTEEDFLPIYKKGTDSLGFKALKYKTSNQKIAHEVIKDNILSFIGGSAGTGKSFLACYEAAAALKSGKVRKIILARPTVEAGPKMGFLPGDANAKVEPYLIPLIDNLEQILGESTVRQMIEDEIIKFEPIQFLRGRTLRDSFIILDEAQNLDISGLKLFLTRVGDNAKVCVTYDHTQVDIKRELSCVNIMNWFMNKEKIGFFEFEPSDVVRSEIAKLVVEIFSQYEQ